MRKCGEYGQMWWWNCAWVGCCIFAECSQPSLGLAPFRGLGRSVSADHTTLDWRAVRAGYARYAERGQESDGAMLIVTSSGCCRVVMMELWVHAYASNLRRCYSRQTLTITDDAFRRRHIDGA